MTKNKMLASAKALVIAAWIMGVALYVVGCNTWSNDDRYPYTGDTLRDPVTNQKVEDMIP